MVKWKEAWDQIFGPRNAKRGELWIFFQSHYKIFLISVIIFEKVIHLRGSEFKKIKEINKGVINFRGKGFFFG